MAQDLNPELLFANPNPFVKEIIDFIDAEMAEGKKRLEVEQELMDKYEDVSFIWFFQSYLSWKYPNTDEDELRRQTNGEVPEPEERTNEDKLEFGDLDGNDDDDDEFERMLNNFIKSELDKEEEAKSTDAVEFPGGYRLHCEVNDSRAELPVNGSIARFTPADDQFLHIDIELPDVGEKGELHIHVELDDTRTADACFDRNNIPLFRDSNRLHVAPICIPQFLGADYELSKGKSAHIDIVLFRNNQEIGRHTIAVNGPWPTGPESSEKSAENILADIHQYLGWDKFKAQMDRMLTRCEVDAVREKSGLAKNPPRLHTAIIGNAGSGKTTAVKQMAKLYKELGLLDTDNVWTTRVSTIATSNVNGENDAVNEAVGSAQGGTLVIERAHELFKTDKPSYDTEGRIVRALVDALNDTDKYPRWMLVLVGEPEGMESLLSSYPELTKCLTAPIYLEDFKPDELFSMFDRCCKERGLTLSDEARMKLQMYVLHKYNHRGTGFQNALLVQNLFDDEIIPSMYVRLRDSASYTKEELELILPEDIPTVGEHLDDAMDELDELVGLGRIKSKVKDYLNAVKLASRRMEQGLPTNMPRLHMAFLGNPGTGKTTVAEIIGKVFASWGILSGGRVIRTEKSQMVGQYIGETEFKMKNLLARAKGNILFIDEAYQLVEGGEKDFGRIVMNSLLTELGKDNLDMVVILAGYTAPMKKLIESNEGIESRFPNVFNFEDYTTDELMDIGRLMICKQGFTLTEDAAANMRAIIEEESDKPSPRFGNGRFVSNLLQNEILATLGARTAQMEHPTKEDLSTILPEDVVVGKALKDVVFDDVAIDEALARLDALAGLDGVKKAIHNFVRSARYLHAIGEPYVGKGLLSWRFIGNSGTGKSTVAEIMAGILRGMRLISNRHITEIKGERIFNVSEHDCDEVLREAVKKSCNGLIFIDVDEPKFTDDRMSYGRSVEQIRLKINELTVEAGGECALILAELNAPHSDMAQQLSEAGVYEFDHTLIFKDFTPEELYRILCRCLEKFSVSFSPEAEKHIREYLAAMNASVGANARTMKLMARTIYQQVILRESALPERQAEHKVLLADVETFRWNGKKGKIGF